MLSFEIVQSGPANLIQICCDDAGLTTLLEALKRLGHQGHVHLLSPSNGGHELAEATPFGKPAIQEVIITDVGGE